MKKLSLLLLVVLPLYSCNSPKEKEESTVYEDPGTGWTTQYPASFDVMTDKEIAKLEGRGEEALEKTVGEPLDLIHKNLLWLKKDQFNSFTSNSQPFDSVTEGDFTEQQEALYAVLEETYSSQGIKFDVNYTNENIDGLDFMKMETTLYTPNSTSVLMNQVMYTRLIDGKLALTLNYNYNNDHDKELLSGMIKSSKFSKRN